MTEKKSNRFKSVLWVMLLVILTLPLIQAEFNIPIVPKVGGWSYKIPKPTFTLESYLNGEYQKNRDEYNRQNVGYKRFFIKPYNQFYYSFFKEAKANSVIIGKDNYLFETPYIDEYMGKSYIGYDSIRSKIQKLEKLNDTLQKKDIQLIVLLAPGKASFYPEFIPEQYDIDKRTISNYQMYAQLLSKSSISFLDFHRWFRRMKDTTSYPLFPKTGIHWSSYGEVLATDSLIRYLNNLDKIAQKIPSFEIIGIDISNKIKHRDDDIEKGMNLMFDIKDLVMAYPKFIINDNKEPNTIKVLTIADSYYWGLYNMGLSKQAFGNGEFWFYNQQVFPERTKGPKMVQDLQLIKAVEKNDIILLLSTDATLHRFAFGFIDNLYEAYFKEKV
tara:strand:+ start:2124 stop:3281 length:1158 start_codon:yes stop_codon:yes gene_type:complete